ncbi:MULTISPECIES: acyltransferase [unclassified Pseudomonas]|uniref:acyltransferase family protein n=1 Tax=unclassified Pseudomonas TaxID=196821 RepID=UPI000A91C2CC|nr:MULTISPECIES: acyltransferase family protein [unclassified Pseudomonas]
MKLGAFKAPDIAPVPVLSTPYLFEATWPTALRDALFGALALGDSRYNYVLWTIQIELIGSFGIFVGYALFGSNAMIYRTFCVLGFLLLSLCAQKTAMYCSLFFLGSMLVTFHVNEERGPNLVQAILAILGLCSGLYLAGYHPASHAYTWITEFSRNLSDSTGYRPAWFVIIPALGGLFILLSVLSCQRLFRLLESAPIRLLGKLSFSIYLLHTFILVIAGQFFTQHLGLGLSAMLMTLIATLTVTLLASYFFHLKVDVPAISLSNRFASWVLGTSTSASKQKKQAAQATA